jgi:hypothetical protein
MRNVTMTLWLASVCLTFAGAAHAQSLADIAKKEKARRAQITETRNDGGGVVVDDHALRNANGSTFSAAEVTGAPKRAEWTPAPGQPLANPNRRATSPPTKTAQTTTGTSNPTPAETEKGRGWSTQKQPTSGGRGWNHRRKEILESMGRTVEPIHPTSNRRIVGRDHNGVPIYQ